MSRSAATTVLLAFLGLAACDAAPKVEPAATNELKALPMPGTPVAPVAPVVGGVRDPSVKPVGKTGIPDDSIRPAKLRTGVPDDSVKPAPKP